jgi:nicotinamidase-related amidase
MSAQKILIVLVLALTLVACASPTPPPPVVQTVVVQQTVVAPQTVVVTAVPPTVAPTATAAATATINPASVIPVIPAPVAASVDAKTTAMLVLDLNEAVCTVRKSCVASLPNVAALLKKARDAKSFVVYSEGRTPSPVRPEVAQLADEPKVGAGADKFFNTTLDDLLKGKGIKTVVIVGSASNGAVLYTAFGASLRGYTVVVADDGMSTDDVFAQTLTRYQLLNQPGFANAQNTAPQDGRVAVTISKSDLITFK